MAHPRAWIAVLLAAVMAPLITWLPMLAVRYPGSWVPPYHPAMGIDIWQMKVMYLVSLTVVALLLWPRDRWLSCAVALAGALVFLRAFPDPTHAMLFGLGAVALAATRQVPERGGQWITAALAGVGVFESGYVLQQRFFHYDVLWGPLLGGTLNPVIQPLGTLGTVDATAAYIAVTAPLLPWWLLPLPIVAVWTSQSLGAMAALFLGLTLRYAWGHRWRVALAAVVSVPLAAYVLVHVKTLDSVWPRLYVWSAGLIDAARWDPVLGYGLGGWAQRIPALQAQYGSPTGELWREAHSEPVQWACELGAVGLVVLAGWLWTHRAMFGRPRVGPAVAALALNSCSFFLFHTVATALLGILLVGLATRDESPQPVLGG